MNIGEMWKEFGENYEVAYRIDGWQILQGLAAVGFQVPSNYGEEMHPDTQKAYALVVKAMADKQFEDRMWHEVERLINSVKRSM